MADQQQQQPQQAQSGSVYPAGWVSDCQLVCRCPDASGGYTTPVITLQCKNGGKRHGLYFHKCPNQQQGYPDSGCDFFQFCLPHIDCCLTKCDCGVPARTIGEARPFHVCGHKTPQCGFKRDCSAACPHPVRTPHAPYTGGPPQQQQQSYARTPAPAFAANSRIPDQPVGKRQKVHEMCMFKVIGGFLQPASLIFEIGLETPPTTTPSLVATPTTPASTTPSSSTTSTSTTTPATTPVTPPVVTPDGWTKSVAYQDGNNWFIPTSKMWREHFQNKKPALPTVTRYINNDWVEKNTN